MEWIIEEEQEVINSANGIGVAFNPDSKKMHSF